MLFEKSKKAANLVTGRLHRLITSTKFANPMVVISRYARSSDCSVVANGSASSLVMNCVRESTSDFVTLGSATDSERAGKVRRRGRKKHKIRLYFRKRRFQTREK